MNTKEKLVEFLENVWEGDLVHYHNEYCDEVQDYGSRIYSVDDLEDVLCGESYWSVVQMVFYGDFRPTAEWFMFDGYGNIKSIYGYNLHSVIQIDEIAEYCAKNENSLGDDDILYIIISEGEEEEK